MLGHEVRQRPLQRRNPCEADILVHLAQLTAERRRRHDVSGFPAGDVVGLAEGADDERTLIQLIVTQHAGMLAPVEYQMLVHLIAEQIDVTLANQCCQAIEITRIDQCTAGVVRCIQHDHTCARRNGVGQALPVDMEIRQAQLLMNADAASQLHRRLVTVVTGIEDDDLVAQADHRLNRTEDRLGSTRGYRDLGGGIHFSSVQPGDLHRDLLAQGRQSGHRCILVVSRHDMAGQCLAQRIRAIEIGKALGEIQRTRVRRQLGHGGEDGRANVGQFTDEHVSLPTSLPHGGFGRKANRIADDDCAIRDRHSCPRWAATVAIIRHHLHRS